MAGVRAAAYASTRRTLLATCWTASGCCFGYAAWRTVVTQGDNAWFFGWRPVPARSVTAPLMFRIRDLGGDATYSQWLVGSLSVPGANGFVRACAAAADTPRDRALFRDAVRKLVWQAAPPFDDRSAWAIRLMQAAVCANPVFISWFLDAMERQRGGLDMLVDTTTKLLQTWGARGFATPRDDDTFRQLAEAVAERTARWRVSYNVIDDLHQD